MISWSGYGLLAFLLPLIAAAFSVLFSWNIDIGSHNFKQVFNVLFVFCIPAIWIIGKRLNGDAGRYAAEHTFMTFPLQYTAFIYMAILLVNLMH
ncbi:MAG: hypothetical protein EOO69_10695 [Moraxellaceae bacterium]|nr:MAG: hypothetical protein EOO69_10695 [Moraxellaceae bacterium]